MTLATFMVLLTFWVHYRALLWGRVPLLFAAVALLYGVLDRRRSPLDPVLRTLVTVRVSQLNRCRFCMP